jgi:hypothetical protein
MYTHTHTHTHTHQALVSTASRLYVMGGGDTAFTPLAETEFLDPINHDAWHPGPPLVYARSGAAAVVSGQGELLVMGGSSALPRPLATFERLQVFLATLGSSS